MRSCETGNSREEIAAFQSGSRYCPALFLVKNMRV